MSLYSEMASEIYSILRLRTLPLGIKFLKTIDEMNQIPKLRTWPQKLSFCQYVTISRTAGWTLGITVQNLSMPACMFTFGLAPIPEEGVMDGQIYTGVWMKDKDDAAKCQQAIPRIPYGKHNAIVLSPLTSDRLEDPDVALFYGNPGQFHLLLHALQWEDYQRFTFYFSGEGTCADSVVECYLHNKPQLTVPCFGQRRFAHVMDDELEMAVPPSYLVKIVDGLKNLRKARTASYPIVCYGPMVSALPVVTSVYPSIEKYIAAIDKGEFLSRL